MSNVDIKNNALKFKSIISGSTSGIISSNSNIEINFISTIDTNITSIKTIKEAISFNPSVDFDSKIINGNTLIINPKSPLKSDTKYNLEIELSDFLEVSSDLELFEAQFKTLKQDYSVVFKGIEPESNDNFEKQIISGIIYSADYIDSELLKNNFSATQNDNSLSVKIIHSDKNRKHEFFIEGVTRTNEESKVVLNLNGKNIGGPKKILKEIDIPSIKDFKVLNHQTKQIPEQSISVFFSDPLDKNQNLKGLVSINSKSDLKFIIQGNELKIYPKNKITGSIVLNILKEVKNKHGFPLKENKKLNIIFSNHKPEIRLIGKGNIVPNSNGVKFPFEAVSLSGVKVVIKEIFANNVQQFLQVNNINGNYQFNRVGKVVYNGKISLMESGQDLSTWSRFTINIDDFVEVKAGTIYQVVLDISPEFSLYQCEEKNSEELRKIKQESISYDDDEYYYDYNDGYNWSDRDNPCKKSYYLRRNRSIQKNIFGSNIGIIAKGTNNKDYTIIVSDLNTTEALTSAEVSFYSYQNQLIHTEKTNANGLVTVNLKQKPYLVKVIHQSDIGYLKIDDGNALSLSMFDVSGSENKVGIKGFIYGERGVWRPGDSLFLSFILQDLDHKIPNNLPIKFQLINPQGKVVNEIVKPKNDDFIYKFIAKTKQKDLTGNYLAKVIVANQTFTKRIKIETIKPNRLKIKLDLSEDIILKSDINKLYTISSEWLHGATAKGLKYDIDAKLSAKKTSFKNYQEYNFDNPVKNLYSNEQRLKEGVLDENGESTFSPNFNVNPNNCAGMLKVNLTTKVYEKGGNFSIKNSSAVYSPFNYYYGINVPKGEGWNKSLTSGKEYEIPVVCLDGKGNNYPSNKEVVIEVYELHWRWWWESINGDNSDRYQAQNSRNKVFTKKITLNNGKGTFKVKLPEHHYGRYLIKVSEKGNNTNHSTGKIVYFDWPSWYASKNKKEDVSILNFNTDKSTYNLNETINVDFNSDKNGKAIIAVENGNKVLSTEIINTIEGKTSHQINIKEGMSPNVYIHITYIQSHNQTDNDLPIRLYGVRRIIINDETTVLEPSIEMPESLAPEKTFSLKVSENNGKEMDYTIAIVDEGLLDITNYKTPKPHQYFYALTSLGVKTWDLYDQVLGANAFNMSSLLTTGGDEMLEEKENKDVNRFKPVVKYIGPFHLNENENRTHKITLPNYIGSVKTMVVAANNKAYGQTDKTVKVKKPLMVLATLPRVLSINETLKLPVSVFVMDENISNFKINLITNELIINQGSNIKTINVTEQGEKMVYFDVATTNKTGKATVYIEAESKGKKSYQEVEIYVRNPNPYYTSVFDTVIPANSSITTNINAIGDFSSNTTTIETSISPSFNLDYRLKYLIQYPHGCIEQTTSSVFPQLHLDAFINLSFEKTTKIKDNINAAIERIKTFQTSDGGFAYWPGGRNSNEWGSNYAGHFLIEAEKKGYDIPLYLKNNWISYQKDLAERWNGNNRYKYYYSNEFTQAYRLYTLALANEPCIGAMNRLRLNKNLSNQSKARLSSAYFLIGQEEIAKQLMENISTTENYHTYSNWNNTYGSQLRDQAMMLESYILADDLNNANKLVKKISKQLQTKNWYSTQTTAFCLVTLSKLMNNDKTFDYSYTINQKSEVKRNLNKIDIENLNIKEVRNSITIKNPNSTPLYTNIINAGKPTTLDSITIMKNLMVSIKYTDIENRVIDIKNLKQGTDFICSITVKNNGKMGNYKNLSLSHIIPTGWEIINERLNNDNHDNTNFTYQDIRDDRVYTYFNLNQNQSKTFYFKLNASYVGKFIYPSVICEAMYDNEISAKIKGKVVSVSNN